MPLSFAASATIPGTSPACTAARSTESILPGDGALRARAAPKQPAAASVAVALRTSRRSGLRIMPPGLLAGFSPVRLTRPAAAFRQRLIRATQRHERHQSKSVHHAAGDRRHVRRRRLDALDRDRGRHGGAGERRQCLRCRGGDRVHPASGRAASQRSRRRRSGHRLRRQARQAGGHLRTRTGAGRRHHRALSPRRTRPGARHRAPRRLRARHVRDLDALLRDYGTLSLREVLAPALGYAQHGYPLVERASATIATVAELFRRHWPTSAAVYLPNGNVPAARHAVLQSDAGGDLRAHPRGSGKRRRRPGRANRTRPPILVARFRRRSDRPFLPDARRFGYQRQAASRRADRRRHGALDAARGGAADLRLWPLHRVQDRAVGTGPGHVAAARAAQRLRPRPARPGRAGFHPLAGRMRQARLCRPGSVLRRSGFRRGPDCDAVVGRLQCRAAQARRHDRLA